LDRGFSKGWKGALDSLTSEEAVEAIWREIPQSNIPEKQIARNVLDALVSHLSASPTGEEPR
jgi:hypothetical protein